VTIESLLLLASVGGVVLGIWDLTRHRAHDVLGALAAFITGMLLGATALLLLPQPAGAYIFGCLAVGSAAAAWKALDGPAFRRNLLSPLPGQLRVAGMEALLEVQGRADELESNRDNWVGPALAFVFALILAGIGMQGEPLAVIAAAFVMAVPFGRLARHHLEVRELKELDLLLQTGAPAQPTQADPNLD